MKLPKLERIECEVAPYSPLARPAWVDVLVERLQLAATKRLEVNVAERRVEILGHAVRRTTRGFEVRESFDERFDATQKFGHGERYVADFDEGVQLAFHGRAVALLALRMEIGKGGPPGDSPGRIPPAAQPHPGDERLLIAVTDQERCARLVAHPELLR